MKKQKFFKLVLSFIFIISLLYFFNQSCRAQSCSSNCNYPDTVRVCETQCGVDWFCSEVGSGSGWGNCCVCNCGTGAYGPRTCSDGSVKNVGGCNACPPTDVPPPPTSAPCCRAEGRTCPPDGAGPSSCTANGCIWTCIIPTPPVSDMWICDYPGALDPDSKCHQMEVSCTKPDTGGSCFTTQSKCIAGCLLKARPPLTPRPQLNLLTPCAQKGFYNALDTGIGCFPVGSTNEMLVFILRWALGVGGGITFLLIVTAGFIIMASGANAERVKAGKELLTAALTGLILLIFSVFILDFVGLRVLQIPGL